MSVFRHGKTNHVGVLGEIAAVATRCQGMSTSGPTSDLSFGPGSLLLVHVTNGPHAGKLGLA
jgi:hypothetical protein